MKPLLTWRFHREALTGLIRDFWIHVPVARIQPVPWMKLFHESFYPFISSQWYRISSKLASNLDCSEISKCIQWTFTTVSVQRKVGFHPVFSFLHVMTMKKTLKVIYSFLREKRVNVFLFCIFLFNKYNN